MQNRVKYVVKEERGPRGEASSSKAPSKGKQSPAQMLGLPQR